MFTVGLVNMMLLRYTRKKLAMLSAKQGWVGLVMFDRAHLVSKTIGSSVHTFRMMFCVRCLNLLVEALFHHILRSPGFELWE